MPLHWRPVGPEPASTYWQRRAVVATAAVLLLVLLTVLLTGGSDDPDTLAEAPTPTATATPTDTASPTPSDTASPTPSASAACTASDLRVEADADKDSYPVGGSPRLSLSVTNTSAAPCSIDLGQPAVELIVFSGDDRIWSSDDCAPGGRASVQTLQPDEPAIQRVTWNGRRSLPGCRGSKAQAQAGTYRATGRVGTLSADGDVFRFTS